MDFTPEMKTRLYNASMDSVNLLQAGKPTNMTDADWKDTVKRNVDHLKIMVAKQDFWLPEHDLTPFIDAISAYEQ